MGAADDGAVPGRAAGRRAAAYRTARRHLVEHLGVEPGPRLRELENNGLVNADSITDGDGNSTIRVRANLNKFNTANSTAARNGIGVQGEDAGEDIKYYIYPAPANNTTLLARYDQYAQGGPASTVLANRLDSLHIHYFAQKVTYSTLNCDITAPSAAEVASRVRPVIWS